jgi:peptidoglycan hydrolase-like protein with peptidoglycan-binding domain
MLPKLSTAAIATTLAVSVSLGSVAPAEALGRNERNFLKGVAATLLIGAIVSDARARTAPAPAPAPAPRYQSSYRTAPQPDYQPRYQPRHDEDRISGRVIGSSTMSGTAGIAAQAFNAYPRAERRAIQSRLRSFGYYSGAVDGIFGPATYRATEAYARDSVGARALTDKAGAFGIYDSLLY